jgi:hypothetical protein
MGRYAVTREQNEYYQIYPEVIPKISKGQQQQKKPSKFKTIGGLF